LVAITWDSLEYQLNARTFSELCWSAKVGRGDVPLNAATQFGCGGDNLYATKPVATEI
jgi:hypothetical protein